MQGLGWEPLPLGTGTRWLRMWPRAASSGKTSPCLLYGMPCGRQRSLLLQHFHRRGNQEKGNCLVAFSAALICQRGLLLPAHSRCPYQLVWVWWWALRRPSILWPPRKENFSSVFKDPRYTELDEILVVGSWHTIIWVIRGSLFAYLFINIIRLLLLLECKYSS